MSAVFVLIPVITAVPWPVVGAAVLGVAASMGLSITRSDVRSGVRDIVRRLTSGTKREPRSAEAEVKLEHTHVAADDLAQVNEFVLEKAGVKIRLKRKQDGTCVVCVEGKGRSKAELEALAKQVSQKLVQQLVYNRVVTELKGHDFQILDSQTEEGDRIRIRVARYV